MNTSAALELLRLCQAQIVCPLVKLGMSSVESRLLFPDGRWTTLRILGRRPDHASLNNKIDGGTEKLVPNASESDLAHQHEQGRLLLEPQYSIATGLTSFAEAYANWSDVTEDEVAEILSSFQKEGRD